MTASDDDDSRFSTPVAAKCESDVDVATACDEFRIWVTDAARTYALTIPIY